RQMLADVVIQREFALGCQQMNGKRGELLGYRSDVKHAVRANRNAVIKIRHAIAALVENLPAFADGEGTAGGMRAVIRGKNRINLLKQVIHNWAFLCQVFSSVGYSSNHPLYFAIPLDAHSCYASITGTDLSLCSTIINTSNSPGRPLNTRRA